MKEELLHYVWRLRRFNHQSLHTTKSESLEIIQPGTYNSHAGPDFLDARIRIGSTLWAGHVEMHLKASDWYRHQHEKDPAYQNVILHVVLHNDIEVTHNGSSLPCLVLQSRISKKLVGEYHRLQHNEYWIPCQTQLAEVATTTRNLWLDRLLVERLEQKTAKITQRLEYLKNNWETTFYQYLARNFGFNVNADAFEELARSLPLLLLDRYRHNRIQFEALLFGQASLLEGPFEETYPKKLQREYHFLQHKHQLEPIPASMWRFLRLRPANFPTIRLAQFAALLFQTEHLFDKALSAQNIAEVHHLFDVQLSPYWHRHYQFGKPAPAKKKKIGKKSVELLLINTIIPFLFLYGKLRGPAHLQARALSFLESLPPENNVIIRKWKELGMEPISAYRTQALLQLRQQYCTKKRCLECAIGCAILK